MAKLQEKNTELSTIRGQLEGASAAAEGARTELQELIQIRDQRIQVQMNSFACKNRKMDSSNFSSVFLLQAGS